MSRVLMDKYSRRVLEIKELYDLGKLTEDEYRDLFTDIVSIEKIESDLDDQNSNLTAQQMYRVLCMMAGLYKM